MYQSKTRRQPANFSSSFAWHSSLNVYRVLTKANKELLITIALNRSTNISYAGSQSVEIYVFNIRSLQWLLLSLKEVVTKCYRLRKKADKFC